MKRAAAASLEWASEQTGNVQIFDTAGRQEIDAVLIEEIKQLKEFLKPQEVLLVADAATGQQAVSVATHFHEALGITGIVLTKLDGDARGGAALSMREVTQRPIKFGGVGEKLDQFEPFVPDRLAGRILGMGDIVGLVEKAAEAIDEEEAARMEKKLRTASFDFNDFLAQFKMMRKLGPLENILGMLPGVGNIKDLKVDEKQIKRTEAIVLSMTNDERKRPGHSERPPAPADRARKREQRDRSERTAPALQPDAQTDEEHGQDEADDGADVADEELTCDFRRIARFVPSPQSPQPQQLSI